MVHLRRNTQEIGMTADQRPVATDALATPGTITDETAGPDAIHLAVEPVIAAHTLHHRSMSV
jgi:hypothetical protein